MQLLYAIPKSWKEDLSKVKVNIGYSRPSYNKKRPYVFSKQVKQQRNLQFSYC